MGRGRRGSRGGEDWGGVEAGMCEKPYGDVFLGGSGLSGPLGISIVSSPGRKAVEEVPYCL